MKKLILLSHLLVSGIVYANTIVDQHFSSVAPTGWTSTSNVWNFARNESATGNYRPIVDATTYSARFSTAATGNSIYIYIPIDFKKDSVYTITFYTKRVCGVEVNTNELPNQTTLLSNQTETNPNCTSNFTTWYEWNFTVQSSYTGAGYFQIWTKTIYGGPTSVYLDDLTITESSPKVLPISLLDFNVDCNESENVITWTTAMEYNNDFFTIEKSIDGYNFESIQVVKGAEFSSVNTTYQIKDSYISSMVTYYRLKQTDFDGKIKVYHIISSLNIHLNKTVKRVVDMQGIEIDINSQQIRVVEYTDGTNKILR